MAPSVERNVGRLEDIAPFDDFIAHLVDELVALFLSSRTLSRSGAYACDIDLSAEHGIDHFGSAPVRNMRRFDSGYLFEYVSGRRQGAGGGACKDRIMTVRRDSDDYFDAAPTVVAIAVRAVLARRPPYVRADEIKKDAVFTTNIKPHRWLLGTDMTIQLQPSSGGTQVKVDTTSQPYIVGDVFDAYALYIRDFLRDLRGELSNLRA
ncbi:MAG: hypothetical protein WB760_00070 [Xanthobacteraceae bacterium]